MLAHHLYQAGAAADAQRTAKSLLLAGTSRARGGRVRGDARDVRQLIGLELAEDDPLLAEAYEHRGERSPGCSGTTKRPPRSIARWTIYIALKDDAGIERAARGEAKVYGWRGRPAEGLPAVTRGLKALSSGAARERALLLSWFGTMRILNGASGRGEPVHGRGHGDAVEQLDDADTVGRILIAKAWYERMCGDYHASARAGRRALALLPARALWHRADVSVELSLVDYFLGRLAECDERLPEVEKAARPVGHGGALFMQRWLRSSVAFQRTGDLRAFLAEAGQRLQDPRIRFSIGTVVGLSRLYLGDVDEGLEQLATVMAEMPDNYYYEGTPEGNLFAGHALAGRHDWARALLPAALRKLPVSGRRNVQGAFFGLDATVAGLTLIDDREQCGALYPLTIQGTWARARSSPRLWPVLEVIPSWRRRWPPTLRAWPTGRENTSKRRSARRALCPCASCSPRCCTGTDACSHPRPMATNDRGGARWSRRPSPISARSTWRCTRTSPSSFCATDDPRLRDTHALFSYASRAGLRAALFIGRNGDVVRLPDARAETIVSILTSVGNIAFEMNVKGQNVLYWPYALDRRVQGASGYERHPVSRPLDRSPRRAGVLRQRPPARIRHATRQRARRHAEPRVRHNDRPMERRGDKGRQATAPG